MPEPTDIDRHQGIPANDTDWGAGTLAAPIDEYLAVVCGVLNVGDLVVAVPGLFAETLPQTQADIGEIALLHADGDWYESTLDIFNHLYDRVVDDGFIQVDDYGHWEGCRQAIREFDRRRHGSFPIRWIDETGVWFRKSEPTIPECNYWRNLYSIAEIARKQGRIDLARRTLQSVLKLIPNLIPAEELLREIEPQTKLLIDPETLKKEYRLRSINLVAFPDWTQSEELLWESLSELLNGVLTHPDRDRICLLLDLSNTDPEQADLTLSSLLMSLLADVDLDIGEAEPEITLVKPLSPTQWQNLLPFITARIPMETENQKAIEKSGSVQLPRWEIVDR
jgi:Macrocin-O-methyltransferase (TylF)